MKIGIDATAMDLPFSNGIKTYTKNLIISLGEIDKVNKYYIFSRNNKKLLINKNFNFIKLPSIPLFKRQIIIPLYAKKYNLDILHFLEPYGPIFPFKLKIVTTVQDLAIEKIYYKKNIFDFTILSKKILRYFSIKNSNSIITSTNSVKSELMNFFGGGNKKTIQRIYYGPDNIYSKYGNINRSERFILAMSDFSYRKNINNTILAYSGLPRAIKQKYKLYIVVSTKDVAKRIEEMVLEFGDNQNTKVFSDVSDIQLSKMYRSATLFLYPSLYEGFGLPILEAMKSGCPVITSSHGATKEIAGNAAYLVNPRSVFQLKYAIQKMITDRDLNKNFIKSGLIRAGFFSWKKCAMETYLLYQKVYAI